MIIPKSPLSFRWATIGGLPRLSVVDHIQSLRDWCGCWLDCCYPPTAPLPGLLCRRLTIFSPSVTVNPNIILRNSLKPWNGLIWLTPGLISEGLCPGVKDISPSEVSWGCIPGTRNLRKLRFLSPC